MPEISVESTLTNILCLSYTDKHQIIYMKVVTTYPMSLPKAKLIYSNLCAKHISNTNIFEINEGKLVKLNKGMINSYEIRHKF